MLWWKRFEVNFVATEILSTRGNLPATVPKGHPVINKCQMNFGQAIEALKNGQRVAREGWNGKGMWIALMPALSLPPRSSQEPGAKVNDRTAKFIGEDTPLNCQPYLVIWTAQQTWQPGWHPSQPDILAEDWVIAE